MDGHSGLENKQVNEARANHFQSVLSYLKDTSGGHFIIHATPIITYSAGLQPVTFLQSIGLERFSGQCQFFHDRCFWRHVATIKVDFHDLARIDRIEQVHAAYTVFASKLDDLYALRKQEEAILRNVGLSAGDLPIFMHMPVIVTPDPSALPSWIDAVKFPRLIELEGQRKKIEAEISDLSGYLPLIYETGDQLEAAAMKTLRLLGLNVEKAPKGFTVDLVAETPDGTRRFGFEVTGLNGPIKKDSPKLTQLLEFERLKERGEKVVLIANTYNTTPVVNREGLEHFTPQVVSFLSHHPILLMTGWDLYRMVRGVMTGARTAEEIIVILHETSGVLSYS